MKFYRRNKKVRGYRIHLIRHGKTEANEKGIYIGNTDFPLSEEGRRELTDKLDEYISNVNSQNNIIYDKEIIDTNSQIEECIMLSLRTRYGIDSRRRYCHE